MDDEHEPLIPSMNEPTCPKPLAAFEKKEWVLKKKTPYERTPLFPSMNYEPIRRMPSLDLDDSISFNKFVLEKTESLTIEEPISLMSLEDESIIRFEPFVVEKKKIPAEPSSSLKPSVDELIKLKLLEVENKKTPAKPLNVTQLAPSNSPPKLGSQNQAQGKRFVLQCQQFEEQHGFSTPQSNHDRASTPPRYQWHVRQLYIHNYIVPSPWGGPSGPFSHYNSGHNTNGGGSSGPLSHYNSGHDTNEGIQNNGDVSVSSKIGKYGDSYVNFIS